MTALEPLVTFDTDPSRYRHWRLSVDGPVATLAMDVSEDAGIKPGYKLKLNSYDLGVDIELHDALQRIRFEHPAVRCVVITSLKDKVFCSGANIFMLGGSSHAWKVNFCKFTNETRNGIEDASAHSGIKFLAACNGTTAGGGYELALACDEILLIDDRSSAVSLPEVSLLGVLPGTGGLTRLTDKRKVRRDYADVLCTTPEGVRAARAKAWNLVDDAPKSQDFEAAVARRAAELARTSNRPHNGSGVALTPLKRTIDAGGYRYEHVDARIDRASRIATITVCAPPEREVDELEAIVQRGADWWPLAMARELDDTILMLRTNDLDVGIWLLKTRGHTPHVLAADAALIAHRDHWFVREVIGMLRRTLSRLDLSSRSLFAIVDEGSCSAGTLLELALAADRGYMLLREDAPQAPRAVVSEANFALYPGINGRSRLATRLCGNPELLERLRANVGHPFDAAQAVEAGLGTMAPDELDWDEELRIALEERASLSPDALTALEANLRFPVFETMETRIFGRLAAWQNWVFSRPNAAGAGGALKAFGTGRKPAFDWDRA